MTNKTLKIALVLDSSSYGGIETHVANLAKGLVSSGHHVHIVLLNNYGVHPVFETDAFLRTMLIKLDGGIASFHQFIKSSTIDLVHTHGYKAGIIGRISCKLLNKTVVSTFHSGEKGDYKLRFYQWLDQLTASASPCICVSKQIKDSANLTAQVIENFIEMPANSLKNSTATQIAFVGRLSIEKGPDIFLRLAKQLPHLPFSMYGDGPMYGELKDIATNNLSLEGHINDMNSYWPKIRFLCITSREEGLPLVAIEALARGIPVISFDIGGLSSVVINQANGWLVPPLNEALFSNAIKQAHSLTSLQHKSMALFAHQHILKHFSCDAVVPKIFSVYQNALVGESHVS